MQYIRIKIILQAFTYKIIGLAVIFSWPLKIPCNPQ